MMHGGRWWSFLRYDETKGSPSIDRRLLLRVAGYARPYVWRLALMLAAIVVVAVVELLPPLLYRDLIDNVLPQQDVRRLNLVAAGLLAVPIVSGVIGVAQRYLGASVGEGIIFDLRQQMYSHLSRMSVRFFTDTKSGEIISRFSNDVVGAQTAITGTLPNITTNVVILATTLAVMLRMEWRLTLLAIAVLPLFLLPARRVGRLLRDIRRRAMELNAEMSSIVQETLSVNGALLVKTFGRRADEEERFRDANRQVRDIGVRRALVGRWFFVGLGMAAAVGTGLVYWVGGHMVIRSNPDVVGAVTIGTLVAFAAYLARLYGPITALTNVQVEFVSSMVSFERVFEYIDLPIEIQDSDDAVQLDSVRGTVAFEDVSFSYLVPGRLPKTIPGLEDPSDIRTWALAEVSFEIDPGQLVALVGPSGAGKSTLIYLLLRLYDPTIGRITLDLRDIKSVKLDSLAEQFGVVMQEPYLFHDTVASNLRYARPEATLDQLVASCRAANVHEVIARMPDGYETLVGERGYRLSGGEKQRLAIARVILKDPRILVLDEATSHLDSHSEALIQAAIEPLMKGRTSLVIAHRLSTVLAADNILVLDDGRLVEQGTHPELLELGGVYSHLYKTQFERSERPRESATAGSGPRELHNGEKRDRA